MGVLPECIVQDLTIEIYIVGFTVYAKDCTLNKKWEGREREENRLWMVGNQA